MNEATPTPLNPTDHVPVTQTGGNVIGQNAGDINFPGVPSEIPARSPDAIKSTGGFVIGLTDASERQAQELDVQVPPITSGAPSLTSENPWSKPTYYSSVKE